MTDDRTTPRLPGPRWVPLLVALSALCVAVATVLTRVVVAGAAPPWDDSLSVLFHDVALSSPTLVVVARVLHWLGSPLLLVPLTIAVVAALVLRGRRGWALYLAATALGGAVISEVVDAAVGRPRPVWPDPIATAGDYSFPSGHTLGGITTWVVYGVICLFLVPGMRGRVGAWALWLVGLSMGAGRLILGVHWPTDVVAGWLFGGGWVLAVSAVAVAWVNRRAGPPTGPV